MRILMTGSSGWLGQTLVPLLQRQGHQVFGLDPRPTSTTTLIGSITDRAFVRSAIRENGIDAIVHSAALHKPDVAQRCRMEFIAVNVEGTCALLEEAVAQKVRCFVFTSTTSLMISRDIHTARGSSATQAIWISEDMTPRPRNIYGVTKLAAEQLCRLYSEQFALPLVVLRTSRFFPEADDMAHLITQSDANTKANELLFRRLTVADAAASHVVALERAAEIGFDIFIISATPPFSPDDREELIRNAPAVVERYFPDYPALYARLGWTMFDSIDRIYDPAKAARQLGFTCKTGFRQVLDELKGTSPAEPGEPLKAPNDF